MQSELSQYPRVYFWCDRCRKRAQIDYRQIKLYFDSRDENIKILIQHVRDLPKSAGTDYRGCLEHFVTSVMDINTSCNVPAGEAVAWHRLEIEL